MDYKIARRFLIFPFLRFFRMAATGGNLLLGAAILALILANSPFAQAYFDFWHIPLNVSLGPYSIIDPLTGETPDLHFWINEFLMVMFFFVVGLEIKRELLVGELSTRKQAMTAVLAAIGGMVIPGLLYVAFNPPGSPGFEGWGIPMVTDIAFAIGILYVLGDRVPISLKVFLTALAIIDDLGAIVIIAIFYSTGLDYGMLGLMVLIFALLLLANRLRIYSLLVYFILGILLWFVVLMSGIHATIAGVLLAFTIPVRPKVALEKFYDEGSNVLSSFREKVDIWRYSDLLREQEYLASIMNLENLSRNAQPPLQRLEILLHPWVTYAIIPIFALANAGVTVPMEQAGEMLTHPILLGIVAGLLIGKPIGVVMFTWLAVRLGIHVLPPGIRWIHIYGLGQLAGIGFTMSLFITNLAFPVPALEDTAKAGIILASVLAGVVGYGLLMFLLPANGGNGDGTPSPAKAH